MTTTSRFTVACLILASTLAASRVATSREDEALVQPLSTIDRQLGEWVGTDDPPLTARVAESLAATSYLSRSYTHGTRSASLFIAYYASQRAGETMHSPKHCLPGGGWELVGLEAASVEAGGRRYTINNYLLLKAGERMRMLYWYQNRDRIIASEYLGKLYLIWDALHQGRVSGSIVRLTLPEDPESLSEGLTLSSAVIPQVAKCFQ